MVTLDTLDLFSVSAKKPTPETRCDCWSHNGFLTRKGLDAASRGWLTEQELCVILDNQVSVSGSLPPQSHWDNEIIEEQHRRFLQEGGV